MFGSSPPGWFVEHLRSTAPHASTLLILLALAGGRATAPWLLASAGTLLFFSSIAHKEQRFIVLVWPLLLTAAGGTLGTWLAKVRWRSAPLLGWQQVAITLLPLSCVVADQLDERAQCRFDHGCGLPRERFAAQRWVGEQADCTGLLVDELLGSGGYLWFGQAAPQLALSPELLGNPLFNYLIARGEPPHPAADLAERYGFEPALQLGSIRVWKRAWDRRD